MAVLGAGAIGAALATQLSRAGRTVALLATEYDGAAIDAHRLREPHPAIAMVLDDAIEVVEHGAWRVPVERASAIVLAVSGEGVVGVTRNAAAHAAPDALWAVATKAWDLSSFKSAARLVADGVGDPGRVVAVAGPSLAGEVARGVPTTVVCAGWSADAAAGVAALFASPTFRAEVSTDVDGVAVAAVLKNVAAVALGLCDGLSGGGGTLLNTQAALFSMALREMEALVLAVGGKKETVLGPAGAGDLFVTCLGGRNGRFGALVGAGRSPEAALAEVGSTVEGYGNARTVVALGDHYGLDLPLMRTVAGVLFGGANPRRAIETLFGP